MRETAARGEWVAVASRRLESEFQPVAQSRFPSRAGSRAEIASRGVELV